MSNVVHPSNPKDQPPPYDAGGAGGGGNNVIVGPDDSKGPKTNIIVQPNITVVNAAPQPVVATTIMPTFLGHYPCIATCPFCNSTVMTVVSYRVGRYTWVIAIILFLLGFFLFCLIPFCVPSAKDAEHNCPNCGNTIGVHKKC